MKGGIRCIDATPFPFAGDHRRAMLSFMRFLVLVCLSLSLVGLRGQETSPEAKLFQGSPVVAEGARLKLLADGFQFTEGPAAAKNGDIYFTDQPNDRIHRWSAADGKVSLFLEPAGRSNGLFFDPKGQLIACADEKNELWSIDMETKKPTVLLENFEGKRFNGPNDVWAHPDGGLFFTDPFYKREYWKHSEKELDGQHVYYLPADRKTPRAVAKNLIQPNGITGTADGKWLYVADIGDKKTYRYAVSSTGELSDRTLAAPLGSDGMTLDREGNLYLTGKGVTVFNPKGEQIEHIPVPESWTANVRFGGHDRKMLFITAMDSVYGLPMKVAGPE